MQSAQHLRMVVPSYNEGPYIESFLYRWRLVLDRLESDYAVHVYDDGSTDETPDILQRCRAEWPRLTIHRAENRGHGPTILRGYRDHAAADWIFQIDSDDELEVETFETLWRERDAYDLLLGRRTGRHVSLVRRLITLGSRTIVGLLFGARVYDVNSPYRLMRCTAFRRVFDRIPDNTFAPNVLLSGYASALNLRVRERPVAYHPRKPASGSRADLGWLAPAFRSVRDTIRFHRLLRAERSRGAADAR